MFKSYRPERGGHAPGDLREQFREWIEDEVLKSHADALELTGKLWNCTDIMPSDLCSLLEIRQGSTYAMGARHWRDLYNEELRRPFDAQNFKALGVVAMASPPAS